MTLKKEYFIDTIMIFFGTVIVAFGLINFNMANSLAEGGLTGISLILFHLYDINPATSVLLLNIPILFIGFKFLGKKALIYTFIGSFSLSFNLWWEQQFPVSIPLENDLLIAALLAGLASGIGSGIVYRFGGTTGGADIVARIIQKYTGISIGKSMLMLDIIVLTLSLTYLSIREMTYTLIIVFIFSIVVDFIQEGISYYSKGVFIISNYSEDIASSIMQNLERGATFIKSEGAYFNQDRLMLYCVIDLSELTELKSLCQEIDPEAFISIIDVKEVHGEGFSFDKPKKFKHLTKRRKEQLSSRPE